MAIRCQRGLRNRVIDGFGFGLADSDNPIRHTSDLRDHRGRARSGPAHGYLLVVLATPLQQLTHKSPVKNP